VVAIPRLAWTLLLLAALMVAMVGGMLMAGSQANRKLAAVLPPVGQVFECPPGTDPGAPGPIDQARPPQDAPLAMTFDRRAGRLVALVGVDDAVETWTFDVCANVWTQMHPSREPFGWVQLAYDAEADRTIGVADCRDCIGDPHGVVWAYDREADTWSETGAGPTGVTWLSYDPDADLVLALGDAGGPYDGRKELWSYSVETGAWTPILPVASDRGLFAYDTSVHRIIAYGPAADPESVDRATRLLDIRTGRWSLSGAVTPGVWGSGSWGAPPAIAYDEAAELTAVFGTSLAAYDATTDRWAVLIGEADRDPSDWLPSSMVYDPVNRRLVGLGRGVVANQGSVVAFDLVARTWTVLLEPGTAAP
jgi:hypothetical protein